MELVEKRMNEDIDELAREEIALVRKIDLYLLPTIWIMYLLSYMDRTNIGNAKVAGVSHRNFPPSCDGVHAEQSGLDDPRSRNGLESIFDLLNRVLHYLRDIRGVSILPLLALPLFFTNLCTNILCQSCQPHTLQNQAFNLSSSHYVRLSHPAFLTDLATNRYLQDAVGCGYSLHVSSGNVRPAHRTSHYHRRPRGGIRTRHSPDPLLVV